MLLGKSAINGYFIFPPHLTSVSALNIKLEGNILQDIMLPSIGPVWCTQSIALTVMGGSAVIR